mgnify:FL=1
MNKKRDRKLPKLGYCTDTGSFEEELNIAISAAPKGCRILVACPFPCLGKIVIGVLTTDDLGTAMYYRNGEWHDWPDAPATVNLPTLLEELVVNCIGDGPIVAHALQNAPAKDMDRG